MKFYQDDDWLEEEPEEVYDDGIEYLYDDDEAEASDQILLDQDSLRRMDSEWEPSESEDDAAVDGAVDPILPYIGDVHENVHDPDAPISTATLLAQLDEVSVERRTQVAQTRAEFDELIKELDRLDRNRERRERYHEILQEGMETYGGIAPSYIILLRDKPTLWWHFHSLHQCIHLTLSFMLADEYNPLRMCKYC